MCCKQWLARAAMALCMAGVLVCAVGFAPSAMAAAAPYSLDVWADAVFGTDGKLQKLDVPEADQYPPAFVERLRKQVATARIPPVKDDDGSAATFQTGIGLYLTVTPGEQGATVKIDGVRMGPRPLKRYAASRPDEMPADVVVQADVLCVVGAEGRCTDVQLLGASAGSSEPFRRWAVASMQGWQFAPQRVNGRPVVGEFKVTLQLEAIQYAPARDFRNPRRL